MTRFKNTFLFEVSWEVCNKVGGIHTVLRSKASHALEEFGENYYLLGPALPQNVEFEETDETCWRQLREPLAVKGIECRFGRWTIPGRPKVILVQSGARYNTDQLLFRLWEKFGVDSIAGGWDYIEPVLFSTTCGEVIASVAKSLRHDAGGQVVAQFHEWMTGAGLLYLKEKAPHVATVFTTHATILGRSMMGGGRNIYAELDSIAPIQEAKNYSITAKHSLEQVSTREADCFTTVSEITAKEAQKLLGRRATVITPNGMNMEAITNYATHRDEAATARQKLLAFARSFLSQPVPDHARLLVISGRYEFSNKGVDVFLEALARMRDKMPENEHIVAFLFVLGGHQEPRAPGQAVGPAICTHRLHNENNDAILISCLQNGLTNVAGSRINIIFCPVYLCEGDGVFNSSYYDLLKGFDLGVFPSKYEPWGYTPHESAAYAVPTITTDLAGFGMWAKDHLSSPNRQGIFVIPRFGREQKGVVDNLVTTISQALRWTDDEMAGQRLAARKVAEFASWQDFYKFYLDAYELAQRSAEKRAFRQAAIDTGVMGQVLQATGSIQPHFRAFTVETELPKELGRLRELASNLWWCWHPEATELFSRIDPFLWESAKHNPIRMLDQTPTNRLAELAANESYVRSYRNVVAAFDAYITDGAASPGLAKTDCISWSRPVAYFSTEFGISESLPVYSGGLGILSGDHLKSASDLNVPLVGVGLYYKHGYFTQRIDAEGNQIADYPENDFTSLPARQLRDENGVPSMVSVDLPGRTLYAGIWKLGVGRVTLYLLDTDLPANTPQDRKVTGQLYVGDERVRIEQEILLGVGGARLLRRLGIKPAVYHLNEGHSAFLVFENIRLAMREFSLSLEEARELVKSQVVFTTHTPVEAGNERFSRDLMQHYFANYLKEVGFAPERFYELGRLEGGEGQPFIMTILALKSAFISNGVSELHGRMSRKMWEKVWNGLHRSMVPITSITNGVHVPTFVAPEMHRLLDTYFGLDWAQDLLRPDKWAKIHAIPDQTLWETKCSLRQQIIAHARDHLSEHWLATRDGDLTREEAVSRLRGSSLTIGFARRFAPYKRAYLLFQDLDRLERIVNNPRRPVQFIFAGKAHPKDSMGCDLVKQVVQLTRDKRFAGRIVFIENYDLAVAKRLVQGVDVWLNTPRRPYEASGTSGQKVAINAGINLSVADGWWCEGAADDNGWTIGPTTNEVDEDTISNDILDANHLYSLLEDVIVPLFYQRNSRGIPEGWLQVMRRSFETIVPQFNTHRMLVDYFNRMYKPCAEYHRDMANDKASLARALSDWKRKAAGKFSSLHVTEINTTGLVDGCIQVGKTFTANVRVNLGDFEPAEVSVDLIVGLTDPKQQIRDPQILAMTVSGKVQDRVATFTAGFLATEKGNYSYGIRIMPCHPKLACKEDLGLVMWA